MTRILITITCLFLVFANLQAATPAGTLFTKANKLYENGKYTEAATLYKQVLAANPVAEVHYNLANAYYRSNQLGLAILHYEKTLLLNPGYDRALENLAIANGRIVDKVDSSARTNLSSYWTKLLQETGPVFFGLSTLICWLLAGLSFSLFLLNRRTLVKKLGFFTGLLTGTLALAGLYLTLSAQHAIDHNRWGIITAEKADAYTEPRATANAAFVVHEGTKVHINAKNEGWLEVALPGGAVGWLKASECKVI